MSLWRKRNVHHNEQNQPKWFNMTALANNDLSIKSKQKHDILTYPLDILYEENVRLGLYEGVYDLSIKSKKIDEDDDIQDYKKPWQPLNWGDMPIGCLNNFDFMEGARWAEKSLKDKNS
jgi:hypothetical protein